MIMPNNKLRKIQLHDEDGDPVTANLWNSIAETPLTTGDEIFLKDVTIKFDKFAKTNVLSVNRPDQLEVSNPFQPTYQKIDNWYNIIQS